MIQLPDKYVVKRNGEYYAIRQPRHIHHDANYTSDIEKAQWFKRKPNIDDDWDFDEDDVVEVISIERFYKIKK